MQTYVDFLVALRTDMKKQTKEIIVGGDFNSKSYLWGSEVEDARGEVLSEWLAEENLIILNQGGKPTFIRENSKSHIDITFCSKNIGKYMTNWKVLEVETLSCHQHIVYEVSEKSKNQSKSIKKENRGWIVNKD